jgi:FkbM family methyltransferase
LDLPLRYARLKLTGQLDIELEALRKERPDCSCAIDVGTNIGIYSYFLSKFCRKVESFEPVPQCTKMLDAYAKRKGNITIHNVGLSSRAGRTELYYPYLGNTTAPNLGLSSFTDPGGRRGSLSVDIKRLDDYAFTEVGIIKIDVEGHEYEVLLGAVETIRREKPVLLVEIEQRHLARPMTEAFGFILNLGYAGGFYRGSDYLPLEQFSYERDQAPYLNSIYDGNYVNNFLFKPLVRANR